MSYTLYVSVPLAGKDWSDVDRSLTDIATGYDCEDSGAGTGFGNRDRDWVFTSKEEAEKMAAEVKKVYVDADTSITTTAYGFTVYSGSHEEAEEIRNRVAEFLAGAQTNYDWDIDSDVTEFDPEEEEES